MKTIAEGTAYLFGNNIDTDQIYPGKYVELTEMEDIRKHAMSGSEEPDLATFFQPGDIIVAGTNFGCGYLLSQRHQPGHTRHHMQRNPRPCKTRRYSPHRFCHRRNRQRNHRRQSQGGTDERLYDGYFAKWWYQTYDT